MYKRDLSTLPELGAEIIYLDELTGQQISGIVLYVEYLDEHTTFAYIASPYKDENNKEEILDNGMKLQYRDIIVFDDKPNTMHGWHRDTILGNYGKYVGNKD